MPLSHLYRLCLLTILLIAPGTYSHAQEIQLRKNKELVFIQHRNEKNYRRRDHWIGFTTQTDTIIYHRNKKDYYSYEIHAIDSNSITVKKPKVSHDTTLYYEKATYPPSINQPFRRMYHYTKDDKKYYKLLAIDEYEYRTFQLKDLTTIQYPPKGSVPQTGCIMCILPPFWPILYHQNRLHGTPRNYDLRQWKLTYSDTLTKTR